MAGAQDGRPTLNVPMGIVPEYLFFEELELTITRL